MGTVGNAMNAINVIIAENERDSPFKPLSVRRGFKENENVVTLFAGWGILSAKNWKADVWGPNMNYPQIIKDIYNQQDAMFGTIAVLSPPIARFVADAGYDTAEKFTEWVTNLPAAAAPLAGGPGGAQGGTGTGGTGTGRQGRYSGSTPVFTVVVTGGSNNNYWCMGGMRPQQAVQIDKWR
jgi:hypothetical protein